MAGWSTVQLDTGTRISCCFSGFKGVNDLAIVQKAVEEVMI
ncbi:MAG: hypothetical protein WDO19_16965 [Bacteroidota bacterium]